MGTVIITGAASGIGAATASMAARKGFAVCVNYLANEQGAEQVVADITAAGGQAIALAADVRDEAAVGTLFDETEDALGSVTGLVNNLGLNVLQSVEDVDMESFERILDINLRLSLQCTQAIQRA